MMKGGTGGGGGGGGGGEIIQVEGGHIVRSTGRKDRHSKVYTSKGPRDRRVRLSAHTAIQFYDVQDRLGYDRPSKAVDWLIKKAKDAIDRLEELPPWNPNNDGGTTPQNQETSMALQQFQRLGEGNPIGESSSSYMPPQIGDSMKLFFPTSSAGANLMNFQDYPQGVISRASIHTEDLGLSLHTMQETRGNHKDEDDHRVHFTTTSPLPFEVVNYAKTSSSSCWSSGGDGNDEDNRGGGGGGGGFVFVSQQMSSPHQHQHQPLFVPQREPLQSNSHSNDSTTTPYSHLIHHHAWNINHQNSTNQLESSAPNLYSTSHFRLPAPIQSEIQQQPPGPISDFNLSVTRFQG